MKIFYCLVIVLAVASSCSNRNKKGQVMQIKDTLSVAVADTTRYGICGTGTAMNTLELITDGVDTVSCFLASARDSGNVVGGLSVGDSMAVVGYYDRNEGFVASKVINLTSLLGRWGCIDESFEICANGLVKGSVREPKPYTSWRIFNGQLVLAPDTFDICFVGIDSLSLRKAHGGLFGFRRLPARQAAEG